MRTNAPGTIPPDTYGRWSRRAVWCAMAAPNAPATDAAAVAMAIREQLQRHADAAAASADFEVCEAEDGYRVSGRDVRGGGVDVVVRRSGELTVTPHEDGRPLPSLVEDFRVAGNREGLEYRAAPWRRHGTWLPFEAAIGLRPDLA